MKLCFGTFATVLNCCRQDIDQAALIARIAKVVDSDSRYIGQNRYKSEGQESLGDKPAASKLLSCKMNFVFTSNDKKSNLTTAKVIENFKVEVVPFINEDKKVSAIFALLSIIRRDEYINTERKETFKKYYGFSKEELLQQSCFDFADFLGKTLLYTTCGDIDNTDSSCAKMITDDYIKNIVTLYKNDYEWDVITQTLTLSFIQEFDILNQAIKDYEIDTFIEKVDPTVSLEFIWGEQCDGFLKYTEKEIWIAFGKDSIGEMLKKIQLFAQTLDDYTKYLGCNMRPVNESSGLFVPLYRDENIKWELDFIERIRNYRKQLIFLYQDIYMHATLDIQDAEFLNKDIKTQIEN